METKDPSRTARLADVRAEIAQLQAQQTTARELYENRLAGGEPTSGTEKAFAALDAEIAKLQAKERGLVRVVVLDERAALEAAVAEGELLQQEALEAYSTATRRLNELVSEFSALERDTLSLRVARDNSHIRCSRRREALAKFIVQHGAELERAERAAETQSASEPKEVGALRS